MTSETGYKSSAKLLKMKRCYVCGETKLISDFHADRSSKDGHSYLCRACNVIKQRNYRAKADPEKFRAYSRATYWRNPERRLRMEKLRRYGLSEEELLALERRADGKCEICKRDMPKPYVDHDHETGAVRGLLCNSCNRMLGWLERVTPEAAVAYLKETKS